MGASLEGGCRVRGLRDGAPRVAGTLRTWPVAGRATGTRRISLRTLEFHSGESPALRSECDDVWYVLDGEATLDLDGRAHELRPGAGVHVARGRVAQVRNAAPTPLVVASARCPEPDDPDVLEVAPTGRPAVAAAAPVVHLGERPRATTGDRWYVELVNDAVGCREVTQFVGSIPPGRAPDHYHNYEEVIVVLAGHGVAWAGPTHAAIAAGSCIYLPQRQVHCLENTGSEPLLLVGVFYPAGSPAVRYEADSSATEAGSNS